MQKMPVCASLNWSELLYIYVYAMFSASNITQNWSTLRNVRCSVFNVHLDFCKSAIFRAISEIFRAISEIFRAHNGIMIMVQTVEQCGVQSALWTLI